MKPVSRRSFLQKSSAASATAFTIIKPELVRGAGDEKLRAGLVGCGGRGTQAATQLLTGNENVELVAMGDIFEDKLEKSLASIRDGAKFPDIQSKVKVDPSITSSDSTLTRRSSPPTSTSSCCARLRDIAPCISRPRLKIGRASCRERV